DPLLRLLLPLPGRRRGAGRPAHPGSLVRHVGAEHRDRGDRGLPDPPGGRADPPPAPAAKAEAPRHSQGGRVKILDRYVLRETRAALRGGLISSASVFIVAAVFEKRTPSRDTPAPATTVALYYAMGIPGIALQVLPMAMLLSSLLALGQLSRGNE